MYIQKVVDFVLPIPESRSLTAARTMLKLRNNQHENQESKSLFATNSATLYISAPTPTNLVPTNLKHSSPSPVELLATAISKYASSRPTLLKTFSNRAVSSAN